MKQKYIAMPKKQKSIKMNMALKMVEEAITFIYPLVTSMYIIRTIGQNNYGQIKFANSIVSYFSLIAGLGIGNYAAREGAKIRDDRIHFQKFSNEIFTINLCSTSLATLLFTLFIVLQHDNAHNFNYALYIICAVPMIAEVFGRAWINTVFEDFSYITIRYSISSVVTTILIFVFIHNESDYLLYVGLLSGLNCILVLINCVHVHRYAHIGVSRPRDCSPHIWPIMLIFFSSISSKIYLQSDVTILGIIVNTDAVAVYSVAATLYAMVKQITNSAISVTIPRLSYYMGQNDEEQFHYLLNKLFDYSIVVVFPSVVGLIELHTQALVFLGGSVYAEGGITLCVLSLALPFAVLANILGSGVLLPARKEKVFFYATTISAALNISLNFVFIPWLSHTGAAITTLISEIVMFIIFFHVTRKITTIILRKSTIISVIIGCLSIAVVCELSKSLIHNNILCTVTAIIVSVAVYGVIMIIRKHPIIEEFKSMFVHLKK